MLASQIDELLACEDAAEREAAMRKLCSSPPLSLWKHCRDKRCRRVKACAGECDACFTRHWPLVAADLTMLIHAYMKAGAAGIVRPEIGAELFGRVRREYEAKAAHDAAARRSRSAE
jgi:hypothetical protein